MIYRFGEAQLMPMTQIFFLDPRDKGGLGMSNTEVGLIYNTVGVIALICGGLLGGIVISAPWPEILAVADAAGDPSARRLVFVWLAAAQPHDTVAISTGIAIEQFGYGFGFASYMLYIDLAGARQA